MLWFIFYPMNLMLSILCYLTNWLAVLFADERGELHGSWLYWQTWDDSLDVEWFVKETVPKIFRYDFDKHYVSTREAPEYLKPLGRDKGAVKCINNEFTLKERIQRYFCRVLWLYRNNGYGFAFYWFGNGCAGNLLTTIKFKYGMLVYDRFNPFYGAWKLSGKIGWLEFLAGWKLAVESSDFKWAMITGRILIRK